MLADQDRIETDPQPEAETATAPPRVTTRVGQLCPITQIARILGAA